MSKVQCKWLRTQSDTSKSGNGTPNFFIDEYSQRNQLASYIAFDLLRQRIVTRKKKWKKTKH